MVSSSTTARRILIHALRAAGCDDVTALADGREALEIAQSTEEPISALVTDWELVGLDGLDLTRQVRSGEGGGALRVMMVTSRNARADVERALEVGVDVYLLKPFTTDALRAKIEDLLQPLRERERAEAEAQDSEAPPAKAA